MKQSAIKKLKESLPWGAQTEVARSFGKSQSYVNQVLNGHAENDAILDELIKMARDYQRKLDKISKEFENKVKSI